MTVIYPSPIFGPIHSRRLGVSLGINLMPADGKVCTFNCIYCECGFNEDFRPKLPRPTREEVRAALEARLQDMKANGPTPDVLTLPAMESRRPIRILLRLSTIRWPYATAISRMPKSVCSATPPLSTSLPSLPRSTR